LEKSVAHDAEFEKRVADALIKGEPMPDFPTISPLKSLAMAQAAVVREFKEEGFDSNAALYLTAAVFTGNPGIAPSSTD